jgi:hypothetical protein
MTIDRLQLMVPQPGKSLPTQLQRAEEWINQPHAQTRKFMSEKSQVEGRIVGHEDALSGKIPKTGKNIIRLRLAYEHIIADAVHMPGNG